MALAAGGDCPSAFDSDDCDVGGTTVCYVVTIGSETQMLCDLSAAGGDSVATVVRDYNGGNRYSGWGSYGNTTTKFCCAYSSDVLGFSAVKIDGSDYNDTLKYTYNGTHELSETGVDLHATIDGHDGNDTITGSNRDSAYYFEWFEGGGDCTYPDPDGGDDTIVGGGGVDTLRGQCGDDLILGGPGMDIIVGGTGDDSIIGGLGGDDITGDDGVDSISGGDGDDVIDGGNGADILCGDGGGGDVLSAGDTVAEGFFYDKIWDTDGDEATCGHSSTRTGGGSLTETDTCGTHLSFAPSCP